MPSSGDDYVVVERAFHDRRRCTATAFGEHLFEWSTKLWQQTLDNGLRLLRLVIDTNLITSTYALPLLIKDPGGLVLETTDGTAEFNAAKTFVLLTSHLYKCMGELAKPPADERIRRFSAQDRDNLGEQR